MERIYISIREAGEALGISRSTLYRLMETGQLASCKIGRRRLIKREAITALAEQASIEVPAKR